MQLNVISRSLVLVLSLFSALAAKAASPTLLQDLEAMKSQIEINSVDAVNCHAFFKIKLAVLQEERLFEIPQSQAVTESEKIMRSTWQNRLAIHARLLKLASCRTELRQMFYRLRSIEDLAIDRQYLMKQTSAAEIVEFQDQPIPLVANEFYRGYLAASGLNERGPVVFQSGDLMVTRGPSNFSAILSSIQDYPNQLDHFVLINKSADGTLRTVESYAQTGGVAAFPMNQALKNENARIMLLRAKDQKVAAKASDIMLESVNEAAADPSKKIGYDFFMNLENPARMTCSAVTYWGLRKASNDKFVIPEERSTISPKLHQIFEQTGIKEGAMLTAGDIELDTRFELILEWRDPRLIQDSRIREVVAQTIFDWIKIKNYRLRPTFNTIAIDAIIYPLRPTSLWPFVMKVTGSPDFPLNTPKGFLKTLKQLNDIADVLYKRVRDAYEKQRAETGWGMTQQQMVTTLEGYRRKDLNACDSRGGGFPHFTGQFGAHPCSQKR